MAKKKEKPVKEVEAVKEVVNIAQPVLYTESISEVIEAITLLCDQTLGNETDKGIIYLKRSAQQLACYNLECSITEIKHCEALTGVVLARFPGIAGVADGEPLFVKTLRAFRHEFTPGKEVSIKNECYTRILHHIDEAIKHTNDIN